MTMSAGALEDGLALLFQLFFAVMFMIVQFVALFWFLARGRVYWILPGETGVDLVKVGRGARQPD